MMLSRVAMVMSVKMTFYKHMLVTSSLILLVWSAQKSLCFAPVSYHHPLGRIPPYYAPVNVAQFGGGPLHQQKQSDGEAWWTHFLSKKWGNKKITENKTTRSDVPLFVGDSRSRVTDEVVASSLSSQSSDTSHNLSRFLSLSTLTNALQTKSLVAIVVALAVGFRWGSRATRRLDQETMMKTIMTSGTDSLVLPPRARPPYLLQGIVIFLLGREIWRLIPVWLKRQIPFVRRRYVVTGGRMIQRAVGERAVGEGEGIGNSDNVDDDSLGGADLSSVGSITRKLQALFRVASEKLGSTEYSLNMNQVRSCVLALVQLTTQLKERRADQRDLRYQEAGNEQSTVQLREVLQGLDEMFELADYAYDEFPPEWTLADALAARKYKLIRHDKVTLPGCVAHYIAMDPTSKTVVISVKGTSNLEDFLTDACGNAVTLQLEGAFGRRDGEINELRCHEGVLLAAKRLAQDLDGLIEEFVLPAGYSIILTGHSLGAGVAALVGILLRSRLPALARDNDRLRVIAFAAPPVLDLKASRACASFITTVVNNSDVVPRASLSNLVILMEFLKIINQKLTEKGIDTESWSTMASFLKNIITDGGNPDGAMLMTADEISEGLDEAISKVDLYDPDHLYVPGRVIQMYDLWSKEGYGAQRSAEDTSTETGSLPQLFDTLLRPAERVCVTDGASNVLRAIEVEGRMLSDHMAPSYRSSLQALLSTPSDLGAA